MTTEPLQKNWTSTEKNILCFAIVFVVLFIITYTESAQYLPSVRVWTDPFFEQLVLWSGNFLFGIKTPYIYQLHSDSTGTYIHLFNLSIIAFLLTVLWRRLQPNLNYDKAQYGFLVLVRYYLGYQLLLYGFNKVFKWQFFLPEPNTLYTTVGEMPKDLLFWSVMGSSYSYTVFTGLVEVLAACLLLYHRTWLLGALLSIGVMGNVVAINFGFNISVKVHSIFLLSLALGLMMPYRHSLYQFFINQQFIPTTIWQLPEQQQKKSLIVKTIVIWLLFFETLAPYFNTNNFNDDLQERPPFCGAYEVLSFSKNTIPIPPLVGFNFRWKRVFVHRRGYFIVQTMDDKMQDYNFGYDDEKQIFILEHTTTKAIYHLNYQQKASNLIVLNGVIENQQLEIRLEAQDLKKLPLLQNEFAWTIDAIK